MKVRIARGHTTDTDIVGALENNMKAALSEKCGLGCVPPQEGKGVPCQTSPLQHTEPSRTAQRGDLCIAASIS